MAPSLRGDIALVIAASEQPLDKGASVLSGQCQLLSRMLIPPQRGRMSRRGATSGVPSSEESERSRQLGRQDVLDHNPGAPVTFGSECPIPVPFRGAALPIGPEQRLERSRAPRDRRARIEGCCPQRPHGIFLPGRR
jgi:hypothetical protein